MSAPINISLPLSTENQRKLRAGDRVLLTGVMFTARDAAHKRMAEALKAGGSLPISIEGQTLYYVGPTPAKPGYPVGTAGPTTSERMDDYTPLLLEQGLRGMIGKGHRSDGVVQAIKKHNAIYFAATGGAGALLAKSILEMEPVAYVDLGPEAIHRVKVKDFPVIVINDSGGNDWYQQIKGNHAKM